MTQGFLALAIGKIGLLLLKWGRFWEHRDRMCTGNRDFDFGHVEFEMHIRHPNGDFE